MIYFIIDAEFNSGRIKIGYTGEMGQRYSQLLSSSPGYLSVVLLLEGSKEEEKLLHQQFHHLRNHHEWFDLDDDLCSFIFDHLIQQKKAKEEEFQGFCSYMGLESSPQKYQNSIERSRPWNQWSIKIGIKDNWPAITYERDQPLNYDRVFDSAALSYKLRKALPLTGQELVDLVKELDPEIKRPRAYIRQFIRSGIQRKHIQSKEKNCE